VLTGTAIKADITIVKRFFIFISLFAFLIPLGAEEGIASWYGGKFQGRKTASGEIFDTNKFTAAHKTLPFGTIVRVTNLENNKNTIVRITDRGPFVDGRVIDLSFAAAVEIDMLKTGVAKVRVVIIARFDNKSFYRLQVGSYNKKENAEAVRAALVNNGFAVYLEETTTVYTRVCIDNVAALELDAVKKKLAELGYPHCFARKIG
jgi:rare lipoprotein A